MRSLLTPSLFAILLAIPPVLVAQTPQEELIRTRLDEIKKMIDEETRTIGVLENQLKRAIDREQETQIERIRTELDEAWTRVETLKQLDQQLNDLMDTASQLGKELDLVLPGRSEPDARKPGDRDVPRPSIAGLETREDIEKVKRELMQPEEDPAAGQAPSLEVPQRPDQPDADAAPRSTRLDQLRRALQALNDAGEFDLARQVEQRIRREEDRLAATSRPQAAGAPPAAATPPADNRRPQANIRRPQAADPPPAPLINNRRERPERRHSAPEQEQLQDLLQQMREEIQRLRKEVDDLKNQHDGG